MSIMIMNIKCISTNVTQSLDGTHLLIINWTIWFLMKNYALNYIYVFRIYINSCCQMPNDGYLYQIWHIDYRYGKTSFALILKFNWVLHGFTKWISKACLIEILVLYSNFLIYSYGLQIHDISQYCKCTLSKICNDLYVLWKSMKYYLYL